MEDVFTNNVAHSPAKQATSPDDLRAKLEEECDFPKSGDTTSRFAQEVFHKVPRKASGLNVGW